MIYEKRRHAPNHGSKHLEVLLPLPLNLGTDSFRLPSSREPTSAPWLSTLLLAPLLGKPTASPTAGKLPLELTSLASPAQVLQGMFVESFAQIFEELTA